MNRDEILEKSRAENKNQDVYEKQVLRDGGYIGSIAAAALATVFFVVQIFTGGGMNYGIYAIVFTIPASSFIVKSLRLRRKHEIVLAAMYTVMVLLLSAAHIYGLVTGSAA